MFDEFGGRSARRRARELNRSRVAEDGVPYASSSSVSDPPTDSELNAIFGTAASVGTGFFAILNDADLSLKQYIVWSDGGTWWYLLGNQAT